MYMYMMRNVYAYMYCTHVQTVSSSHGLQLRSLRVCLPSKAESQAGRARQETGMRGGKTATLPPPFRSLCRARPGTMQRQKAPLFFLKGFLPWRRNKQTSLCKVKYVYVTRSDQAVPCCAMETKALAVMELKPVWRQLGSLIVSFLSAFLFPPFNCQLDRSQSPTAVGGRLAPSGPWARPLT